LAFTACDATRHSATASRTSSDIEHYIHTAWDDLTRSPLNCAALIDPKLPQGQSLLYVAADQPITPAMRTAAAECGVGLRTLPAADSAGPQPFPLEHHGLLYLPNPYVVPGGRFNEMYGWDSYFIVEGLVEDSRRDLARGMTENFFYQLDHYGAILNANRTYYLTRSQPPFLTSMIRAVARTAPPQDWLARGYAAGCKDWDYWHRPELHAGDTGLTRYFDFGIGPVPEMQDDPTYYQGVIEKLLQLGPAGQSFLRELRPDEPATHLPVTRTDDRTFTLTDDFYKGDRAMRASGYDTTFRFGPYGGATHHFAPVCLNALLYREELDLADFAARLNKPSEASQWRTRAAARLAAINKYLWDDARGIYVDYDFTTSTQSDYPYATTFFPLWAGSASPEQARRVVEHLRDFLQPGGIAMSTRDTGVQWDLPFGWAPVQLLAVEGLRRYGYTREADDVSARWLRMIVENFRREKTIREKYDVVRRTADVQVQIGYTQNAIGFGWTNAAFLKLLHALPPESQADILR
jgi:alpha,alpha-trehalase